MSRWSQAALGLFAGLVGSVLGAGPAAAQSPDNEGESAVLSRINAMRQEQGLSPLERDSGLDVAAYVHSRDMAKHAALQHVSPRTGNPADRVEEAGVEVEALAENIARGDDALDAHRSIVDSEHHRQQLLSDKVTHVGISVVEGDEGKVWLTELLARLPRMEASEPPTEDETENGGGTEEGDTAPEEPPQVQPDVVLRDPWSDDGGENDGGSKAERNRGGPRSDGAPQGNEPRGGTPEQPSSAAQRSPSSAEGSASVAAENPESPRPELDREAGPRGSHARRDSQRVDAPSRAGPDRAPRAPRSAQRRREVVGYWIHSRGRWWYFPVPPDAQPGEVLEPDPDVRGPPPGHDRSERAGGSRVRVYHGHRRGHEVRIYTPHEPDRSYRPAPEPPPPFGWSPRRHPHKWRRQHRR